MNRCFRGGGGAGECELSLDAAVGWWEEADGEVIDGHHIIDRRTGEIGSQESRALIASSCEIHVLFSTIIKF